jgi:hypothetical protein
VFLLAVVPSNAAPLTEFRPGEVWPDDKGVHINAHGGGILFHEGTYFIFSSGCTGWAPNAARLASADKISGPWTAHGNPCVGTDEQKQFTFHSQSTFVLPVQGKKDAFIFMADRWKPENAIDGRYIWLPVRFNQQGVPYLEWKDRWDIGAFD